MDMALAIRLLWRDTAARARERWTAERIAQYQAARLRRLRDFAVDRSPFYRAFHAGRSDAPLCELPVLTKRVLMQSFDEIVTDRGIRLADVRAHVAGDTAETFFRGRYVVCATSGTSGQPGIFLYDRDEWASVLASFSRANRMTGLHADLLHPLRIAMVGSAKRFHQSNAVAATLDSDWFPSLRLSATDPIADICRSLTAWRPELLITYAALSGMLAEEQLAGRLDVAPRAVMCVAESLTATVRARVRQAWGSEPFENYASTESACMAAECGRHDGLHLFDDFLVVEVVDEGNRPVPPGTMGAKVLVSVLATRTIPLIRYEIDDAAMLADGACSCGLAFRRLTRIGGRIAETLQIPRTDGSIASLHPTLLEEAIGLTDVRCWQALRRTDGLHVLLLAPVSTDTRRQVEASLRRLATDLGIVIPLHVDVVDDITRAPSGKMLLVHDETGPKPRPTP
jgi:phenylacetate-coenzyme A ligase PaaK-like adenylate-forming protein